MIGKYLSKMRWAQFVCLNGIALSVSIFANVAMPVDALAFSATNISTTIEGDQQQMPGDHNRKTATQSDTIEPINVNVFGSVAFPFRANAFRQWNGIEEKLGTLSRTDCAHDAPCEIRLQMLADTLDSNDGAADLPKLRAVNTAVNRMIRYTPDVDATGDAADRWATPVEVLSAGTGDCEDYAILKFAALAKAGFPTDRMAITVLRDTRRNLFHAVLTASIGDQRYVLDNAVNEVRLDTEVPQYQALYSLGLQKAWIHGYRAGSEMASSDRPMALEAVQPGSGVPEVF